MANYNFTFLNGELTYKDADGNECSVGGGGGAVYNVPFGEDMLPAVSYNTIKEHFENGDICLMKALSMVDMVIAIVYTENCYVRGHDVTFINTSPDATTGWIIE